MGAAIDVPKAVDYAARFLSHFLDDKIVPESILDALEHLAGPGAAQCARSRLLRGVWLVPCSVSWPCSCHPPRAFACIGCQHTRPLSTALRRLALPALA